MCDFCKPYRYYTCSDSVSIDQKLYTYHQKPYLYNQIHADLNSIPCSYIKDIQKSHMLHYNSYTYLRDSINMTSILSGDGFRQAVIHYCGLSCVTLVTRKYLRMKLVHLEPIHLYNNKYSIVSTWHSLNDNIWELWGMKVCFVVSNNWYSMGIYVLMYYTSS